MADILTVKRSFIEAAMKRAQASGYPIVDPTPQDNDRDLQWWRKVLDAKAFLFSEHGSAAWLFPHYELKLAPLPGRVVVSFAGATILDSRDCFEFRETAHPAQIYIPRSEVDFTFLERSETLTYCPFKSVASHFNLRVNGNTVPDAFWSYEDVYDRLPESGNASGVLEIRGMLGAYRNRLDVSVKG